MFKFKLRACDVTLGIATSGYCAVSTTTMEERKRRKFETDSARKRARTAAEVIRNASRIFIREHITRRRITKDENSLRSDTEVAGFLLDL